MGWLKDMLDKGCSPSRMGKIPAHQHFMFFGNKNDEEVGLPEIWLKNGVENLKWLDERKGEITTVYQLPKYDDHAIIFVGMSPTLKKHWKYLKGIDERFIIVATNSSAKYLIDRGIKPHYVISIDGKPGNWTMDLGSRAKDVTAIFSVCVEPNALRQWPGKIMIVPYGVKDKGLNRKIQKRYGKGLASGGNSINSAVAIFSLLTNAKIFLFVGNELSFKKKYYADRPNPNDDSGYFYTKNIFGEKVRTLIPLFEYKVWLENIAAQLWPEYHFCNCSEGILGVDVDGTLMQSISQKRLDFAIEDIKAAWNVDSVDQDEHYKLMYDHFYDNDFGNTLRGRGMWRFLIDYYEFTKGLDVGCGRANGVELARENGYDVYGCDIADARRFWKERGVDEYCEVCPADKMPYGDEQFDMVLCSEVMEHIPEHNTKDSLGEIFRVGSDKFFFTIALTPEAIPLAGYIQSHINLHPPQWWVNELETVGFKVVNVMVNEEQTDMSIFAVKDTVPYDNGKPISKLGNNEFPMVVLGGSPPDSKEIEKLDAHYAL